jgi:hypothetical protein
MVEVGADSGACFEVSLFWHPATANTVTIAATVMIALIFFISLHPLSSLVVAVRSEIDR